MGSTENHAGIEREPVDEATSARPSGLKHVRPGSHAIRVKTFLERERKFTVPTDFQLPMGLGESIPKRAFTSTYFDTADYRLGHGGVTLRRRVEARSSVWQLKLPREEGRLELEWRGGRVHPPQPVKDLLVAWLRGSALAPIARLHTVRTRRRVNGDEGSRAEVVLDVVRVLGGRRVVRQFTEVEVELQEGDQAILDQVSSTLQEAGATLSSGRPKVFQALGLDFPHIPQPAEPSASTIEHLSARLAICIWDMLHHDPGTRLGDQPEELHQMRVAVRRFRSLLRAAKSLLEASWVTALRTELAWLGQVLGQVRELDVFIAQCHCDAAVLRPEERKAINRLLGRLSAERRKARTELAEALTSPRYFQLLERLDVAARAPETVASNATVGLLVAAEFKKLRKAVRALPPDPTDDALHALRIEVKRVRYAAELAEATVGKPASRFLAQAKRFQTLLGNHQDAVVVEQRLRDLVAHATAGPVWFAVGMLVERQRARQQQVRESFLTGWNKLNKRGRKAWL